MNQQHSRRSFLKTASTLALATAAGGAGVVSSLPRVAQAQGPIERVGSSSLKVSLNAYSFSKLLNDYNKKRGPGVSLMALLDFCAKNNFDAIDPTGYFFPSYPEVPTDEYVNTFKRRAFELGLGISGTGVRNNFTTSDKAVRAAAVQHIKEWVEVAARLGAPVLRVFADTQMRSMTWHDVAKDCTRDQVQAWIVDALKDCAEHGKKYGVIIGVQNHGDFLQSGDELLALINGVGSDYCGAIVDTGYFKTPDPYADMAKVAPYAVNWQIKQSPFGEDSEIPTDLVKLLKIVRASNYRGYLPIETLSPKTKVYDPFTVVPAFLKQLRDAIAQTA
jgi:sugar phosphate isomerase/epimerase